MTSVASILHSLINMNATQNMVSSEVNVSYAGATQVTIEPKKFIALATTVKVGARYVRDEATGRMVPNAEPLEVLKCFAIGDEAETHSYNLVYTGIVRKITAKTVTVVEYEGTSNERVHRMTIERFAMRNWDFDSAAAAERNANWSD